MKFSKLLIVVDASLQEADRETVRSETQARFGLDVAVRTARQLVEAELSPETVLLIGASSVPGFVRTAAVPVVVCHPSALYELGMTSGNADVDYGVVGGWSKVEIERPDVPLAAELRGLAAVVKQACPLGWGRPNASAVHVARLPTEKQEPMWTVFAYDEEAVMPGLVAPHRRAAVLLAPADLDALTEDGWRLVEAAIGWAIHGGAPPELQEVEVGPATLADGHPTRVLTREEYRDWVEERIAKKIFLRLSAIFSGIGLVVLSLGWTFLSVEIGRQVKEGVDNLEVEEVIGDRIKASADAVEKRLDAKIGESVANTLMSNTKIGEAVDSAVTKKTNAQAIDGLVADKVDAFIKAKLDDQELAGLLERILMDERSTKALAEAIEQQGNIQGVLLEPLRKQLNGEIATTLEQRVGALELFVILETDEAEQQAELRRVIEDDSLLDTRLYSRALKVFPAYGSAAENQDLVAMQLGHLERADLGFETEDSIKVFLSGLPGTNIESLVNYLKKKPVEIDRRATVVDALAQIKSDQSLVELAKLTEDKEHSNLGWRGLTQLPPNKEYLDHELRRQTINDVWPRLQLTSASQRQPMSEEGFYDEPPPLAVEQPFDEGPNVSPRYSPERDGWSQFQSDPQQILVNLLRVDEEDWKLVQVLWSKQQDSSPKKPGPSDDRTELARGQGDNADKTSARKRALLVSAWVTRLQSSRLPPKQLGVFADELAERVLSESGWSKSSNPELQSSPSVDALAFAMQHCSAPLVDKFFQKYKLELQNVASVEYGLPASFVLEQALRRDFQLGYKHGAQLFKLNAEEAKKWGGLFFESLEYAHSSDEGDFYDGLAWFGKLLASDEAPQREYALHVMRMASQLPVDEVAYSARGIPAMTHQEFRARLDDQGGALSELKKLSASGDPQVAELLSEANKLLPWLKQDKFETTPLGPGESGVLTSQPVTLDRSGSIWFDFEADGQNRYEIAFNGNASENLRYVVLDAGNQRLAGGSIHEGQSGITDNLVAGTNYVGFWSSDPRESLELQAVLRTRKRAKPVEPGAVAAEAVQIVENRLVKCKFERTGEDHWLNLFAHPGKLYVIETSLLGRRTDTEVFLYTGSEADPNPEEILAYNDDYDQFMDESDQFDDGFGAVYLESSEHLASKVYWLCPEEGDYLLKIRNLTGETRDAHYELHVDGIEVAGELDLREIDSEVALESFGKRYAIRFADSMPAEMLDFTGGFEDPAMYDDPFLDEFDAPPSPEMFDEPYSDEFDAPLPPEPYDAPYLEDYGAPSLMFRGTIAFDAKPGTVYRIRSTAWVQAAEGLVSLKLPPQLDAPASVLQLETTYVYALESGRCQLDVSSNNVAGLIEVTEGAPELAPRQTELGSSLDAATSIDLSPERATHLLHFDGTRGFARFAAKLDEEYLLSVQRPGTEFQLKFAVFKPLLGSHQRVAVDDPSEPGKIYWTCDEDGDYYLGFDSPGEGPTTVLLNSFRRNVGYGLE